MRDEREEKVLQLSVAISSQCSAWLRGPTTPIAPPRRTPSTLPKRGKRQDIGSSFIFHVVIIRVDSKAERRCIQCHVTIVVDMALGARTKEVRNFRSARSERETIRIVLRFSGYPGPRCRQTSGGERRRERGTDGLDNLTHVV